MTVYTSREEWDTNINSVGGKKDVNLFVSPWSTDSSANATQGVLTSGVLTTEFEPPEILIEPAVDGYFYQDRIDLARINQRANNVQNIGGDVSKPGAEGFRKMREPYRSPSRRLSKTALNPSRAKKEKYNPGIPGLVDSYIHQENFSTETGVNILVVLLAIIVFCILFIFLYTYVPKFIKFIKGKPSFKGGEIF